MNSDSLTAKERRELARLSKRWACMKATRAEILRCMELEREEAAAKRRASPRDC
jgi:hypothetical protein